MAETIGDEQSGPDHRLSPDRLETIVTWAAILWVTLVAIVDEFNGGRFGLIGFLAIGPFIAVAFASPRRTALVGLYATILSLVLTTPPRQYDELNHLLRVLTLVASTGVAIWISSLRSQRNQQLSSARTATRNERRRRVAAETAQRMQAMARALTTAADPAQVADAVFAALRDELDVDAAIFATTDERGNLKAHRQFRLRLRATRRRSFGGPRSGWGHRRRDAPAGGAHCRIDLGPGSRLAEHRSVDAGHAL